MAAERAGTEASHSGIDACPPYTLVAMTAPTDLDPTALRSQARRRARAATPDFLRAEVERVMLEKLAPVRLEPQRVLDARCAPGASLLPLKQRFPGADLLGFDASGAALADVARRLAPARSGLLARLRRLREPSVATLVAADPEQLPLAPASVDLIWSTLALHRSARPEAQIAEWYRVLRPQGLLCFSCLGVDTLRELRPLGARMMEFPDMHDIGDLLVSQGFAEPVMDTERLRVTWRNAETLLAEVRAWGGNALKGRFRGLLTPRHRREWLAAIETLRGDDGLIGLSVEIIYGHAWCPPIKKLPAGLAPLQFHPRPDARG